MLFSFGFLFFTPGVLMAQDVDYIRKAGQSAIFIYDASTQPCAPPAEGKTLLPLGSGFVVGIAQKGAPPTTWRGWKFLVTAQHVIGDRTSVILRLNRRDKPEFVCFPLTLMKSGSRNFFTPTLQEVDLIAINIPDIPNTDPTVFDYSLTLDERLIRDLEIQPGTDVFMVGYLFGYAGNTQNYPVTRFGKIALLTNESWYVSERNKDKREQAYLVEMQSIPGLSGAPVIVQSHQFRVSEKGQFPVSPLAPVHTGC